MSAKLLSGLIVVAITAACAKVVVIPVPAGAKLKEEGVFYALPKTVARVAVKVDKDTGQSARFARFAPIFAPGLTPPCGKIAKCLPEKGVVPPSTAYSIQQGATFTPYGEPDPKQVFLVKFTGGGAIDQALTMTWNDMGLLASASASVTNRTADIAVAGLKMAASLGTKMALGSATPAEIATAKANARPCAQAHDNDRWVIPILLDAGIEQEKNPLVANYCDLPATPIKEENSRQAFDRPRDEADLKLAMEAYLLRVRALADRRLDLLLTGGGNLLDPVPMIEKLEKAIAEQLQLLFGGKESTKTWELAFDVRDLDPATPVTLMQIDEAQGVCVVTALLAPDAKAAPEGFNDDCSKVVKREPVQFSIGFHPAASTQLFHAVKENTERPSGDRSFRYVLPAQMRAELKFGKATYGSGVFAVAQHGYTVSLPATRNSKSLQYDLAMIEATGGLKTFKLGTTGGLDAATIDALSGAGGTIVDARNARRKAADEAAAKVEAAADELTILTRESTILKLKDQICELQKKYGLPCTITP